MGNLQLNLILSFIVKVLLICIFDQNDIGMAECKKETSKRSHSNHKHKKFFEKELYTNCQTYFSRQEDINPLLQHFGISVVETRVPVLLI